MFKKIWQEKSYREEIYAMITEQIESCSHYDFEREIIRIEEYDYKFFRIYKCSGCNQEITKQEA